MKGSQRFMLTRRAAVHAVCLTCGRIYMAGTFWFNLADIAQPEAARLSSTKVHGGWRLLFQSMRCERSAVRAPCSPPTGLRRAGGTNGDSLFQTRHVRRHADVRVRQTARVLVRMPVAFCPSAGSACSALCTACAHGTRGTRVRVYSRVPGTVRRRASTPPREQQPFSTRLGQTCSRRLRASCVLDAWGRL